MDYISVAEAAKHWGISERSVRNYCALGRIEGAFLTGKIWNIPGISTKPDRINKRNQVSADLLSRLRAEKKRSCTAGSIIGFKLT